MANQPTAPFAQSTTRTGLRRRAAGDAFHWDPCPEAWELVLELVEEVVRRVPELAQLRERLLQETATRLVDWVEAVVVPGSPTLSDRLRRAGFVLTPRRGADTCFAHDMGDFPDLILVPTQDTQLLLRVESLADFCAVHALEQPIEGAPGAPYRRVSAWRGDRAEVLVVERHGYDGYQIAELDPRYALDCMRCQERFRARRRTFQRDDDGFDHAEELVTAQVLAVGRDMACDLFFAAEREYWQRRNRAALVQRARQDRLGLGWGNHDHHTYRSSRQRFQRLIQLFELLGLECRERFTPGRDAGWGAQVLEQPVTGLVVFADVDMSPEEVAGDFAHAGLQQKSHLSTVGLWCALHGESLLEAGMHHLEGQFSFDDLTSQLRLEGFEMMPSFTELPYLRQAFTVGERWAVRREKVMKLLADQSIDPLQARTFIADGAVGSHLENLEPNQGYKGFNQSGVDKIIAATDPRRRG